MNLTEKLKAKLADIPDKPGCYLMRDRHGKIIYVGKAVSLRKRVQSYFRDATRRHADPKLLGLIKSVCDLDYIVVRSEAEAVLTESRLIKEYKPRYNVSFKDDKRFLLLRADIDQPFPMFSLSRIRRDDNAAYFGPYVSSPATRATLDFIEKKFGLRKCAPRVPDKNTYEHCINDIVRYCSAPCVGRVTPEEYRARFDEACAFLRGERPKYLKELGDRMEEEAGRMEFEKAAALRDTLRMLAQIVRQRVRIAPTPEIKRQNAAAGVSELKEVLGLANEPSLIEAFDVSNISGTFAVAGMVAAVNGVPQKNRYRRFRIKTVAGSDDPAMMAEAIRRRYGRIARENGQKPGLVLVDGGMTQLNAARNELKNLGMGDIPSAGLAKKYEELFWTDSLNPVRLKGDSRALQVLQRLRDEAHRFALDYHHTLRSRKIRESVLDDIAGMGEKKKEQLLKHFGSIKRIMKASIDQLAEAPGIGDEMARLIKETLGSA